MCRGSFPSLIYHCHGGNTLGIPPVTTYYKKVQLAHYSQLMCVCVCLSECLCMCWSWNLAIAGPGWIFRLTPYIYIYIYIYIIVHRLLRSDWGPLVLCLWMPTRPMSWPGSPQRRSKWLFDRQLPQYYTFLQWHFQAFQRQDPWRALQCFLPTVAFRMQTFIVFYSFLKYLKINIYSNTLYSVTLWVLCCTNFLHCYTYRPVTYPQCLVSL